MKQQKMMLPFKSRKLKSGEYVIVAEDATPLIVSPLFLEELSKSNFCIDNLEKEVIDILLESGYITKNIEDVSIIPDENFSLFWKIGRISWLTLGILSMIFNLYSISVHHVFVSGQSLIQLNRTEWEMFIYTVITAISTTTVHEIFHLIFSRNIQRFKEKTRLYLFKATATVTMSHIWVWSAFPRFMAVSSGIIADSVFLSTAIIVQQFFPSWIFSVVFAVLWLRILWQFRFYTNCDGSILVQCFFDNPSFDKVLPTDSLKIKLSRISLKFFGYIVLVVILYIWIYPFIVYFFKSKF